MARKRKLLPELTDVEITSVAAEGKSIARVDDMVVFIPYGAPGDIVNVKLDKKKKSYAEGHISQMVKPSDIRVNPRCSHFTLCGGCKWQHLPYEYQLRYKQQQVTDALTRLAKIELPAISLSSVRNRFGRTATRWNTPSPPRNGSLSTKSEAVRFLTI